jgi:hypothetical protein
VTTDHALHVTASGSTIAAILAFCLKWLPLLQATAAVVAITSGILSMYFALKKRDKDGD